MRVVSVVRPATMAALAGRRMMSVFSDALRRMSEAEENQERRDIEHYPQSKPNTFINITPQGTRMVLERLGKFVSVQEPGWFIALPFIDRITAVHDMREMCLQVSKQQATTKDNVRLSLEVTHAKLRFFCLLLTLARETCTCGWWTWRRPRTTCSDPCTQCCATPKPPCVRASVCLTWTISFTLAPS
jgi:hypothetical protein